MGMVARAQELGFIIGSFSDRPASAQQAIWDKHHIQADFVAQKPKLEDVKVRFKAERYIHIGDRELDRQLAEKAGFEFLWVDDATSEPWLVWDQPQ